MQSRELIPSWRAFSLSGVLRPDECADLVALAESTGFSEAPVTTARGFELRPDVRNNQRVIRDDVALADRLWKRLSPWFAAEPGARPVGLNERFRFYRYTPGQYFAPHRDGFYQRPGGEARSIYTVLLYLNDDYAGGETAFVRPALQVAGRTGGALCFVHPLVHEGRPVEAGCKYVLRTDVMYAIDGLR